MIYGISLKQLQFFLLFFYENCKILNNNKIDNSINANDILDLHFQEKNIIIKARNEDIKDTPNCKSFTQSSIEVPEGVSPFTINISMYLCSVHQITGVDLKIFPSKTPQNNFIYDYLLKNHKKIFKNVEKFFEKNFKEYEQSESICIEKSSDEVLNFFVNNNYSNLKILLGNNGSVKPTNIPNEVEIEHFTKNNTIRISVTQDKNFSETNLFLHFISSTKPIPKQNVSLKIINNNKNRCFFFHS